MQNGEDILARLTAEQLDEIADQRAAADARTDIRQENAVALETIAGRVRDAVTQVLASAHGDRAEAFDDVAEFLRRETDPLTWLDDAADYAWNEGLDRATNFFSGFGDLLTFNATKLYRGALTGDYVDYSSTEYAAGSVAGAVVQFALGLTGGLGVCKLGRLAPLIHGYNAAATVHGVTTSGYNVFVSGDASWTDYLTLATAAGFGLGRLGRIGGLFRGACFDCDTGVVTGGEPIVEDAALVAGSGKTTETGNPALTYTIIAVAVGGAIVVPLIHRQLQKRKQSSPHDALFDPENVDDLLSATDDFPPPKSRLGNFARFTDRLFSCDADWRTAAFA